MDRDRSPSSGRSRHHRLRPILPARTCTSKCIPQSGGRALKLIHAWLAGALDPETTLTVAAVPVTDTLYADVSEWQRPVDDSYPYRVIAIRSNDGTYRDRNWASNYAWCKSRCDENALVFFIVYFVWRKNWQQTVTRSRPLLASLIHGWR